MMSGFGFSVPVLYCCLITSAVCMKWWMIAFLQGVLKQSLRNDRQYEAKLKDTGNTLGLIIFSLASLLPASAFRSLISFYYHALACIHFR